VITVRTLTGIQTELGGTCLAVIDSPVLSAQYDAVAIPKGSKVLGAIQAVTGDAQDRAAVIFKQIVDLNGDQIQLLVPESATDAIGQAGVTGRVNNHFGKKFFGAFAWGLLAGMSGSGSQAPNSLGANFGDVVRNNVAGSFGQVGQSYLQQSMAIRPDIEVRPNTQMRIILGNPLYLRAWAR
jgi:type IV secretion system protein VirB10